MTFIISMRVSGELINLEKTPPENAISERAPFAQSLGGHLRSFVLEHEGQSNHAANSPEHDSGTSLESIDAAKNNETISAGVAKPTWIAEDFDKIIYNKRAARSSVKEAASAPGQRTTTEMPARASAKTARLVGIQDSKKATDTSGHVAAPASQLDAERTGQRSFLEPQETAKVHQEIQNVLPGQIVSISVSGKTNNAVPWEEKLTPTTSSDSRLTTSKPLSPAPPRVDTAPVALRDNDVTLDRPDQSSDTSCDTSTAPLSSDSLVDPQGVSGKPSAPASSKSLLSKTDTQMADAQIVDGKNAHVEAESSKQVDGTRTNKTAEGETQASINGIAPSPSPSAVTEAPLGARLDVTGIPGAAQRSTITEVTSMHAPMHAVYLAAGAKAQDESGLPVADPGGSPHRILVATPSTLEIGLPNASNGWLKVRAEVANDGLVNASISAASSKEAETLHHELPALATFLQQEKISVAALNVHGPSISGEGSGASANREAFGNNSPSSSSENQRQESGRETMPLGNSAGKTKYRNSLVSDEVGLPSMVTNSGSGEWLNVRA
jgi:hypothetical protein